MQVGGLTLTSTYPEVQVVNERAGICQPVQGGHSWKARKVQSFASRSYEGVLSFGPGLNERQMGNGPLQSPFRSIRRFRSRERKRNSH